MRPRGDGSKRLPGEFHEHKAGSAVEFPLLLSRPVQFGDLRSQFSNYGLKERQPGNQPAEPLLPRRFDV
jgi:hypothetical protein